MLGACGTYHTLEELEQQALISGDWSAVEAREKTIARRKSRSGMMCPSGSKVYCERWGASERCACVETATLRDAFNNW